MKKVLLFIALLVCLLPMAFSQNCNPQGNQSSYGSNNVWIGYAYNNTNFSSYKGFITRGAAGNPNFDTDFGGSNTNLNTAGCQVQTETFSVRFKLTKIVTNGMYKITVGGDDGYRLSLNGGNTWVINEWNEHSYQTTTVTVNLSGTVNMVLEYYENSGDNRVSFQMGAFTCGQQQSETYGLNNRWNGYLFDGMAFNNFAGMINTGHSADASFTEAFGGADVYFSSGCSYVRTEKFSARFRLTKTFSNGIYSIGVGGDDGYRLSIDGGNTWLINRWDDHSFITSTATLRLNGTYNFVLEYYENSGDNLLNFFVQSGTILAAETFTLTGREHNGTATLGWQCATADNATLFDLERSTNGSSFTKISTIYANAGNASAGLMQYTATDKITEGGAFYYWVKRTDVNGKVAISNSILLRAAPQNNTGIKIYPTVVTNGTVQLNSTKQLSNVTIMLHDFTGKPISSKVYGKIAAGAPTGINIANRQLPAGIYLLSIIDADENLGTQKITVL
ncbi:MAG: hypothetical protein JNM14_11530 [Ferruginibacter sp.]|nr:hypothetical protein [Ferruginibacter sp.]